MSIVNNVNRYLGPQSKPNSFQILSHRQMPPNGPAAMLYSLDL